MKALPPLTATGGRTTSQAPNAGEIVAVQTVAAPKEQPPRKLSGKRTAWPGSLESSGRPEPLTEGGKSGTGPGEISQVVRQRGQGSADPPDPGSPCLLRPLEEKPDDGTACRSWHLAPNPSRRRPPPARRPHGAVCRL